MRSKSVDRHFGAPAAIGVATACLLTCLACRVDLPGAVPDPWSDAARGAATRRAIEMRALAVNLAEQVMSAVPSTCRPAIDPSLNMVSTHIEYVREAEFAEPERIIEERAWTVDAEGDISATRQLAWALPDGRSITRIYETRRVGTHYYRALDDRFVDVDRIVGIDDSIDSERFEAVDQLLSLVGRTPEGWRPAVSPVAAACRSSRASSAGLPRSAEVEVSPLGRNGRVIWADRRGTVTVTFAETWGRSSTDVIAPPEVWSVDPEPGFGEVTEIVSRGVAEGWLRPGDGSGAADADLP